MFFNLEEIEAVVVRAIDRLLRGQLRNQLIAECRAAFPNSDPAKVAGLADALVKALEEQRHAR